MRTPKKTLFETFFAILGPEGPETPVNGRSDRKKSVLVNPVFWGYNPWFSLARNCAESALIFKWGAHRKGRSEETLTGLAPRIFLIFAPLLREEGGGGGQRGGGIPLKSEEKGGKRGEGEG